MKPRAAWLIEEGMHSTAESYSQEFTDVCFDIYMTPEQLLLNLGKKYDLFVLGMVCPSVPYQLSETGDGFTVGLRLARDLRSDPRTRDTPILIKSTQTDRYVKEIGEMCLPSSIIPGTFEEFQEAVNTQLKRRR